MSIVLEEIAKRYGNQWVVDNVSLEVADEELFVLLGASGSGKSTILRMIAGLNQPTSGRILLHGTDVTHLPPQKRGAGFVFQKKAESLPEAALRVRFGNAAEQIAAEQAASLYEMLVMTARVRSRASRLSVLEARAMARQLGETLMTVLRHADVPVLIAKGERTRLERVLICTAAGEPGKSDVRVGGRLARRLGAKVTLLYVARGSGEVTPLARGHLDRAAATLKAIDVESEV